MWRIIRYAISSRWRLLLVSAVIWCFGFGAHYGFRHMELYEGWPGWVETYIASALAGIVAGTLVWLILYLLYQQNCAYERHRKELGELNHVIRNAMQMITYSQSVDDTSREAAVVEGLTRLDRVLREMSMAAPRA